MKGRPPEESRRWLKLAADQGLEVAVRELSVIQNAGTP
jgi:hypothetical protein